MEEFLYESVVTFFIASDMICANSSYVKLKFNFRVTSAWSAC